MYVILCIIGGAPSTGFAFCVTPVMYMWLKLIIIIITNAIATYIATRVGVVSFNSYLLLLTFRKSNSLQVLYILAS